MKKFFGYSAYALCSLVFFLAILFPGDQAGKYVEMRLSKALGMDVSMASLAPAGLFTVRMDNPGLRDAEGYLVRADKVKVSSGPLSLIRKRPDVELSAQAYGGEVDGRFTASENAKGFDGPYDGRVGFRDIQVETMDAASRIPEPGLVTGLLSGEFTFTNLSRRVADLEGEGDFTLSSGNLVLWSGIVAGMTIPFDEMHMMLSVKNGKIDIKECLIKGELVRSRFSGSIRMGKSASQSRVNIQGSMEPSRSFFESGIGTLANRFLGNKKAGDSIPFTVSGALDDIRFVPK
ncbi:MAG: type II secretion system protein GspN [Desulfatibacillum sp.]|nr:type II secretion system protein GspN [Desulfatibacillum sp.]